MLLSFLISIPPRSCVRAHLITYGVAIICFVVVVVIFPHLPSLSPIHQI